MDTSTEIFFDHIQKAFWRLPLVGRVAVWMLSAWLFAWPFAYLSAGRENEMWLRMLPLYGACGVLFFGVRLFIKSQKKRLGKLIKSPSMRRNFSTISQNWVGIQL